MKLSILIILLTISQVVQSQTITFTVNIKASYNVDIELRRAVYEDTTFIGWWLEKENPTVRMSSTQYRVTLPLNNKYIITFIDPRTDKWKMIYIEPGDVFKANSQFTVTADFNTTDGLSILYNYDTKMFMFRTLER
jgi:hypothetical protein